MRTVTPGEIIACFVRRHGPAVFSEAEVDAALPDGDGIVFIGRTAADDGVEVSVMSVADATARRDRDRAAEVAMRGARVQG